jgi:hypothetical protein
MPPFAAPPDTAASADTSASQALVPIQPAHPTLAALSRLPALAWRQPAVRAAVRTGASALALSLALRLAGRWATGRGARQAVRTSALLPLGDIAGDMVSEGLDRSERRRVARRHRRRAHVTETFVYMRRTVR